MNRLLLLGFLVSAALGCEEKTSVKVEPAEPTSQAEVRAKVEETRETVKQKLDETEEAAKTAAPELEPQNSGEKE